MNREAFNRVTRARSILVQDAPFFGVLALHLDVVERPDVETLATDGASLFYAPAYVLSLTDPELLFWVAHEAFHCGLHHMGRIGPRDLGKANEAADYAINPELVRMKIGTMPAGALLDWQYAGMSFEEIYAARMQAARKAAEKPQDGNGAPGKPDAGKGAQSSPAGAPDGKPGAETFGGGGIMRPGDGSQAAADAMAERWEVITRQAIATARRQAGTVPGMVESILAELNAPRLDVRDVLAPFIDSRVAVDYSFSRPNRRYLHSGMILPGAEIDGLEHLIFAVDTSGSIDGHMLAQAAAEPIEALESGKVQRLTVLFADTHVRHVQEFERGDDIAGKLQARGGGGTAFDDAFRWIAENASDATAVIYLTDMECSRWGSDPGMPVLWAVHGDSRRFDELAARAPFGDAAYVGRLE